MSYSLHLVGDIPLGSVETVIRTAAEILGPSLQTIPDGCRDSSKAKDDLVLWTKRFGILGDEAGLEIDCGFAGRAITSYQAFARLKREGLIAAGQLLQIDIAPAFGNTWNGSGRSRPMDDRYNARLLAGISEGLGLIDTREIVLQIEVSMPVAAELADASGNLSDEFAKQVIDFISAIPLSVAVMLHLCCKDGASYSIKVADAARMAALATAVCSAGRPVRLVHIPVPLKHENDEFFRPLAGLDATLASNVCLGLIHLSDGESGAARRLEFAHRHLHRFAIAARCGFGNREPGDIPRFLNLHAAVARQQAFAFNHKTL